MYIPVVDQKGKPMMTEHLRAVDLDPMQVARCKELSYGDEGYMCDDLARILDTENRRRYRYSKAILATEDNQIVGWALVQPIYRSRKYDAQLFVDPSRRRQGIGARLLKEANQYSKPYVYIDEDNDDFFKVFPELHTR